MDPSPYRYLKSLADEVDSQSNRVRDLIGDAHWLTDGRHKEQLLAEVVRRHAPHGTRVATGFVIGPRQVSCSTEQDILVLDDRQEAPIFVSGSLAVAFPRTILAAISVKSSCTSQTLAQCVEGLSTVKATAVSAGIDPRQIWCGAYFFRCTESTDQTLPMKWYRNAVGVLSYPAQLGGTSPKYPPIDVLACSTEHAFIVDASLAPPDMLTIRAFKCRGLATAVFLAHLIDHMAVRLNHGRSDFADFADLPEVEVLSSESFSP